ncbi:cupin domain-containing protein [Kitasatospora sp. NPDC004745]|uniref:cupin domain-containing protein n=1 Tax=unclassified Kitasatospora TaxID=2633591 RepID=UPI0033E3E10B
MNPVDLMNVNVNECAARLPQAWQSRVLGLVGAAEVKLLRMDGRELPVESHAAAEVLLVVDGVLQLYVEEADMTLRSGELVVVPAGARHAVRAGSRGSLLIVETAGPGEG